MNRIRTQAVVPAGILAASLLLTAFVHAANPSAAGPAATNKPVGPAPRSKVEPFNPDDFAYLDKGKTIPWASQQTVDAFVAHLKSQPIDTKYADWKEPKVSEEGWWTYHVSELGSNNYRPEKIESCAAAIAFFKRQLDELGIQFIFMPVAEGSMIYPDLYWDKVPLDADGLPPQITLGNQRLFTALDKAGVKYVNNAPAMILARKFSKHGHCRQFVFGHENGTDNSHWNAYGTAVAAHELAKEIVKLPLYKDLPKLNGLTAEWVALKTFGPADGDPRGWNWERRIKGLPKTVEDAQILVVGDSNMGENRGFTRQLMYELKVPIENLGGMGRSPAMMSAKAQQDPAWLLKKKLVVWVVANRTMGMGVNPKPPVPAMILEHTIFPGGLEAAKKKVAALGGNPARFTALVSLEKNSTAKTPDQWRPYTAALIYGRYKVEGLGRDTAYPYKPKTLMAAGWGLVDGKQTWLAKLKPEPGTYHNVKVEAMADHPELKEAGVDQDAYEDLALPAYLIVDIQDGDPKGQYFKGSKKLDPLPKAPAQFQPAAAKPAGTGK
jgi:hypothetical protein